MPGVPGTDLYHRDGAAIFARGAGDADWIVMGTHLLASHDAAPMP